MLRAFVVLAGVFLGGCATAPAVIQDRDEFLKEGTREFRGETRERLIMAAQRVLRQSDPNDFEFRDSMNGFVGLRKYFVYAIIASASGTEKWEFETQQHASGSIQASVSVSEAGNASNSYGATPFDAKMANVDLYRLFWDRVDYVLGRRANWISCQDAASELNARNINYITALAGLCGPTSDGRDAPAPPALPPTPHPPEAVASQQPRKR